MANHDIIVVGGSAGAVPALQSLLPLLPADLPAAIFIVLHRLEGSTASSLAAVLRRGVALPVEPAVDGSRFRAGHMYVGPSNGHLLLGREQICIERSSEPHPSRSGVDSLFASAALNHGGRVIGVLLSGMLADGTAGLWDVRRRGGITVVQDPAEARFPSMPRTAMNDLPVHYCLRLAEIASTLVELTRQPAGAPAAQRARVLIVEDESIVALNLENRLRDLGYDVVGALASGEEAVESVAVLSPDIVLMDVQLAGAMRGTEAARILWERHRLPILFMTTYSDEQTVSAAKESMPYAYIFKPYQPAEIHTAIQLALDRREREAALPVGP